MITINMVRVYQRTIQEIVLMTVNVAKDLQVLEPIMRTPCNHTEDLERIRR